MKHRSTLTYLYLIKHHNTKTVNKYNSNGNNLDHGSKSKDDEEDVMSTWNPFEFLNVSSSLFSPGCKFESDRC